MRKVAGEGQVIVTSAEAVPATPVLVTTKTPVPWVTLTSSEPPAVSDKLT